MLVKEGLLSLSSVILSHEFTFIKGVFDCAYTGIRICKSFLVTNLLYPFLDHLKFLHIQALIFISSSNLWTLQCSECQNKLFPELIAFIFKPEYSQSNMP